MAGETILVTGGAGYIGAHTCLALAQAGYTVVVYDSLVHGHRAFAKFPVPVQARHVPVENKATPSARRCSDSSSGNTGKQRLCDSHAFGVTPALSVQSHPDLQRYRPSGLVLADSLLLED